MPSKGKRESWKLPGFVLVPGLCGFMCTCNGAEKQCIRESLALLNEFATEIYGPQCSKVHIASDLIDDLSAQIAALKLELPRFQVVESGVKNCLFIKTSIPDPVGLANHILKSGKVDGHKTRFLMRMIPVQTTCKAYMKEIGTAAGELFDEYFTQRGKTFSIVFKQRNNDSVSRNEVIGELAEMIKFRHPDNKVDLNNPQLTVLVEVLRSVCCLSVLPDYMELRKYNVRELYAGQKKEQVLSCEELPPDVD